MRRIGSLWPELTSFENLFRAYRKARLGKRDRRTVQRFEFCREIELVKLRDELINGSYLPGPYRTFVLHDTKPRLISASPFRDRVVHHAFCNVVEPIFERCFIHDSYASRVGKGTHSAIRRYQQFARKYPYVLKCDIRLFFPSIDHQILLPQLERKIKDPAVLKLGEVIVSHSNRQVAVPGLFPGDDLFTSLERRRGLPIGNQTSQFFGNVYLNALDHFIKEQLGRKAYLRYVDDFVILGNSPQELGDVRDAIEEFLRSLRLWLHPRKRVISRAIDGIRLLGFRVWPQQIELNAESVVKFRRRMRRYQRLFETGQLSMSSLTQRVRAWIGHAQFSNSEEYLRQLLSDIVFCRSTVESSCLARGFVEQQRQEHPLRQPEQEHAREPEQQHRFPCIEHSDSLQ